MGENTAIEWAHHTFNPWMGCTKVSPGCAHCYAERDMDHRYGKVKWGAGQPRVRTADANWKLPLRWNRYANETRPRVFCASLADWLDPEVNIAWLADLLELIGATPNLDWLLLTKRPHLWSERMHAAFSAGFEQDEWVSHWLDGVAPSNVWIGTTVEDQKWADERIPHLLTIPARVRFLSCEPMVGPVSLAAMQPDGPDKAWLYIDRLSWVICGGESGPKARPMHPEWARTLRDQCQAAGVPFLFKQWGEWLPISQMPNGSDHLYVPAPEHDPERSRDCRVPQVVMHLDGEHQKTEKADWVPGAMLGFRIGKKSSGREIDGKTWDEVPA